MKSNVEIKARVADPAAFAAAAQNLCGAPPQEIRQHDVFFRVRSGRLKLRTFADGTGELIQYDRPDASGPKTSSYVLAPTAEPAPLREALDRALGETVVVSKLRRLWLAGRTRIHLDAVEGLGDYMELEVVLADGEPVAVGRAEAAALMTDLGVAPSDLVEGAYADLLTEKTR